MITPEVIYLVAGEDVEGYPGMVWCESSAPSDHCNPDEAVKYVRADIHESTTTELQEEIGHLEDRVISQGQMLREIVNITKGPPVDKIHSTHDAVESVERLRARVAELLVQAPGDAVILATAILDGIAEELSKGSGLGKKMARIRVAVKASELRSLTENADRVLRNDADKAGGQ